VSRCAFTNSPATTVHMATAASAVYIPCSKHTQTHTHTHPFNGPFSGTTQVIRYQKGKTNLDFTEARESEWQSHQLGRMQVCTSLQTDNNATTRFFTGRMLFLPPNQQHQCTEGTIHSEIYARMLYQQRQLLQPVMY